MGKSANIEAIITWCETYRPDMTQNIRRISEFPGEQGAAYALMMTTAFEAGRMFQTTVPSPTTYDPFDVEYYIP